ncbi:MAG: NUDIX domain-containing protein [Thermodesulfobacteriota bacterium]
MKTLKIAIAFLMVSISALFSTESKPQNKPFFQASQQQPYHLSIGAVLFDQSGRIACHHFNEILGHKDIYILMRESMEDNESPLITLHRGLKEEFGATAQPVAFLGSLSGYLPDPRLPFEKTTLYIACQLMQWNPEARDLTDPEAGSAIEWLEPATLISLMERQGVRFQHRADADESEMIKRAIPYIQQKND